MHSENALKARYAAQMMAATAVLAETAPDDFRRRSIARIGFVYCHEFIRFARRAKNEIRKMQTHRERVKNLETLLDRLEVRDWGSYEVIRHRIAAHRQPFDDDPVAAVEPANAAWNDIDEVSLRVLSEDARKIWNELDAVHGIARLETFPPVSRRLATALRARGYEPAKEGLAVGGGSFDATRADAAFIFQGGDLGAIVRELVDAIRNVKLLCQLWQAVNGFEPYCWVVLAAVHVEACTLNDLALGQPLGTPDEHRRLSLLEVLQASDPRSPAVPLLEAAQQALPQDAEQAAREIRNQIGAHVDDQRRLSELLDLLRGFNPDSINGLLDHLFAVMAAAGRADIKLRGILMDDAIMPGLALPEPPPGFTPYS